MKRERQSEAGPSRGAGGAVDRRDFLKLLRLGAIAGVSAPLASATLLNCSTSGRPNVVILLADDLRWDMAGCTGNPYARTPHVDRLAAEGCLFENAFATSGVCAPSRAGFLTGKHGHQCGAPQIIPRNNTFLLNETPFPALLHEAGYYSAHIGKWHLGDGQSPKPGYDYWASYPWLGDFQDPTLWINGEKRKLEGPIKLTAFLETLDFNLRYVAVARNGTVLQRNKWAEVVLQDGDVLEIVRMVGGG